MELHKHFFLIKLIAIPKQINTLSINNNKYKCLCSEITVGHFTRFPSSLIKLLFKTFFLYYLPKRSACSNPCHGQGYQPLDQAAQGPIQPGLECCQGWGIYNFPGQHVPLPHHPLGKEIIPKT